MTTTKAELIQEIEQASDEVLEHFLKIWQQIKQEAQPETLSDFLRRSPLAEAVQAEEISFERDKSVYVDRFVL